MARYNSRPVRRRRARGGCLRGLATLVFVAGLLVLVYGFAVRPLISRAIADRIAGPPASPAQQQVLDQAQAILPTAVAALPPGELVVSETTVNGFIAERPEAIAPLDSATLRFTAGEAVADIAAYGVTSTATVGIAAQDGRLTVTAARIDGPLATVLSGPDLAAALADRLNTEFATQGRRIEAVRIEEGQLVLTTT